jgi:hypothetical protein
LTIVKASVSAPMLSASDAAAVNENAAFLRIRRTENRRSWSNTSRSGKPR